LETSLQVRSAIWSGRVRLGVSVLATVLDQTDPTFVLQSVELSDFQICLYIIYILESSLLSYAFFQAQNVPKPVATRASLQTLPRNSQHSPFPWI